MRSPQPTPRLLLLTMLLLAALPRSAPIHAGSEDKILHALFGISCSLLASAVAAPLLAADSDPGDDARDALLTAGIGLGAGIASGLFKEALDLAGWGDPSWKDFAASALGALAASTGVLVLTLEFGDRPRATALGGGYACFGLVVAIPLGESLYRQRRGARRAE